ncbi:hypothetical protein [Amaricoccus macauensis]|uniref:hypothetical protein n=1 Tax=Amaricoccus macauensis TaxID=57001 RepID=UPI003C7A1080
MRNLGISFAALVCAATPGLAAEGGLIRSGEQAGFSRLVMRIEPTTEWSLETASGRATIFFPGKLVEFSTTGVFDKIPRTRITDVEVESGEDGTSVRVQIGCDCRVSTSFVGARYLALDVSDKKSAENGQDENLPESEVAEAKALSPTSTEAVDAIAEGTSAEVFEGNDRELADVTEDGGRSEIGLGADLEAGTEQSAPESEGFATGPELPSPEMLAEAEELAKRRTNEIKNVYAAEEALLEQIERAASQGLLSRRDTTPDTDGPVDLAATDPYFVESGAPEAIEPPNETVPPTLPLSLDPTGESGDDLAGLARHDQIEAMTVFDRYNARAPERIRKSSLLPECIPDYRLDIDYWAAEQPLFEQMSRLRQDLYGEFDELNETAVNEMAKLYIRFGFGAEAEALLEAFGTDSADKRLLVDLARIMDDRRVADFGPLSRDLPCPGRHGMWLAIAGATSAYRDEQHFATVEEAFADLPPDLRMHVGPRLMENLLDDQRGYEARQIYEIVTRVGDQGTTDLKLAAARLAAVEGDPVFAMKSMSSLVEQAAPNASDALKQMVELGLSAGYAIPDRTVIDLRSTALEQRGTEKEPELRALLAKALAARAEMETSIEEIRAAKADLGEDEYFNGVAVDILANSVPERVGLANYARLVLSSEDMISTGPQNDVARQKISTNLLELGLAQAAERMVIPAAGRTEEGRLLLAKSYLTQGETEKTRRVLDGMTGEAAADLRARSYFMDGDFPSAQEELDGAGLTDRAGSVAWPSGDWTRAKDAASNPETAAMAEYMASRSGVGQSLLPSDDPASLDPQEAFVEPLPQLEDPSLDSARRLLATGEQLENFIQSLLSENE